MEGVVVKQISKEIIETRRFLVKESQDLGCRTLAEVEIERSGAETKTTIRLSGRTDGRVMEFRNAEELEMVGAIIEKILEGAMERDKRIEK